MRYAYDGCIVINCSVDFKCNANVSMCNNPWDPDVSMITVSGFVYWDFSRLFHVLIDTRFIQIGNYFGITEKHSWSAVLTQNDHYGVVYTPSALGGLLYILVTVCLWWFLLPIVTWLCFASVVRDWFKIDQNSVYHWWIIALHWGLWDLPRYSVLWWLLL
jgi:hypothetical protein